MKMKQQINNCLFFVPNLGLNTKIEEVTNGIKLTYTLSCDKEFPKRTFIKKNKTYYVKDEIILYQNNMSNAIWLTYQKLKNEMMLELNAFKIRKLQEKQYNLKQLRLF